MSDDRKTGGWQIVSVLVAVALVLLPLLYVFSIGPAQALHDKGYLSSTTAQTVYYPILVVCERHQWIGALVESYISLWSSEI